MPSDPYQRAAIPTAFPWITKLGYGVQRTRLALGRRVAATGAVADQTGQA